MPKRVTVIDISAVYWRNASIAASKGTPEQAKHLTIEQVQNVSEGSDVTIIAADCPGPYWRQVEERSGWSGYKGQREPKDPLQKQVLKDTAKELKRLGYPILWADLYEADDVIATIAANAERLGVNVRAVTSDKDVYQCLCEPQAAAGWVDLVNIAAPEGDNPLWNAGRWKEMYGFRPEQVPLYLALIGDTVDNMKGVPGVGQKKALDIIHSANASVKALVEAGKREEGKPTYALPADLTAEHMSEKLWTALQELGEQQSSGEIVVPDFFHQVELNTLTTNAPVDYEAAINGENLAKQTDTAIEEAGKTAREAQRVADALKQAESPTPPPPPPPPPFIKIQPSTNLEAALLEAQRAAASIGFDGWNDHHKYSYSSAYAIQEECRRTLVAAGVLVRRYTWRYDVKDRIVTSYVKVTHPASGESEWHEIPFPVIEGKGRPFDKALNAALTTSWGFWLLGFLNLARANEADVCGRGDQDYEPQQNPPQNGNKWHNQNYE